MVSDLITLSGISREAVRLFTKRGGQVVYSPATDQFLVKAADVAEAPEFADYQSYLQGYRRSSAAPKQAEEEVKSEPIQPVWPPRRELVLD